MTKKHESGPPTPQAALATLLRQGVAARSSCSQAGERDTCDTKAPQEASVLLVDDRKELLDSLAELLAAHGYRELVKADGGRPALEELTARGFDLVLLDLIMPDLSGQAVIDFIAERGIDTQVIVVSGDASFEGVKKALTHGAFDFVKKPYEPTALMATLENALRHRALERRNGMIERQLKDSEELHRFIVNSSPDLVYMLDREGRFTFVNDTVESLLGFSKRELLDRHYSELIHPDDLEPAQHLINERRTGERASRHVELRLRSKHPLSPERPFEPRHVWMEVTAMGVYRDASEPTADGFLGSYGTARDISDRKKAEEMINFQAYHDLLTHLPNRALLKDRLSLAIVHARRNEQRLAVMFLDLDRFKVVNDSLGHAMGDRLLKAVANRLQGCLRKGDTLARFGGDEFTLVLPEIRTRDDVVVIAQKILDKLTGPFIIDGHELFVGASIGIAMYPEAGTSADTLVHSADIAMYYVKSRGKHGYQFYAEEMNQQFSTRLSLERELRNALSADEFRVFYQPQIDLASGRVCGVEALARWQHPRLGLVAPSEFLPVAIETGLITQLDELMQAKAFSQAAEWHRLGLARVPLSVNITAQQLGEADFLDGFLSRLSRSGLDPSMIKLELTEETIMQDMELVVARLRALRERGIGIAIDDFGTGYSSLSYLQHFPVDMLKIDRSFVGDIRGDDDEASIINAIVSMARGLKLELVAEGVENRTQLDYLSARGCRQVQGFIFGHPVEETGLRALLSGDPFAGLLGRGADVGNAAPPRPVSG